MAAKKTVNHEGAALEALAKLLSDPAPKVLQGDKKTSGIFAPAAAGKEAARFAEQNGWVEKTGAVVGKGKSQKPLYQITAAGVHAVLSGSEVPQLLRGIRDGLEGMAGEITGLAEQLETMRKQIQLTEKMLGSLDGVLDQIQTKIQPPDLEELGKRLAAHAAVASAKTDGQTPGSEQADGQTLGQEIERFLQQWKERGEETDCELAELYEHLRERHSHLGIGQFHDSLRQLHREGRVRLTNWGGPLIDIPEPNLALFIGHKVMYYVHIP